MGCFSKGVSDHTNFLQNLCNLWHFYVNKMQSTAQGYCIDVCILKWSIMR